MTVSELVEKLQALPADAPVWFWADRDGCMAEPEPELFDDYVSFTVGRLWRDVSK